LSAVLNVYLILLLRPNYHPKERYGSGLRTTSFLQFAIGPWHNQDQWSWEFKRSIVYVPYA